MENPAVRLYRFWREVIRYHAEVRVEQYRGSANDYIEQRRKNGTQWQHILDDGEVENFTLNKTQFGRNFAAQAPLDYRMGLRVIGLSDRHLFDTPRLIEDATDFEPVIQLVRNGGMAFMSLFPNGDFSIHAYPSAYHQIFPKWTFLKTGYAAGKRVWLADQDASIPMRRYQNGYYHWDWKDWKEPIPYVPNFSWILQANLMLVQEGKYWKFSDQRYSPVGTFDFRIDGDQRDKLRSGYAAAERRYARSRRSSELADHEKRKREKIAIYVPKHGRMTGSEAVDRFVPHMRVYEPAQGPKEATDGSDNLVASPVLHEGGVAPI